MAVGVGETSERLKFAVPDASIPAAGYGGAYSTGGAGQPASPGLTWPQRAPVEFPGGAVLPRPPRRESSIAPIPHAPWLWLLRALIDAGTDGGFFCGRCWSFEWWHHWPPDLAPREVFWAWEPPNPTIQPYQEHRGQHDHTAVSPSMWRVDLQR